MMMMMMIMVMMMMIIIIIIMQVAKGFGTPLPSSDNLAGFSYR